MIEFCKETEKKLQNVFSRYPNRSAALLPVLWLAQKEFGLLSREVQAYVAELLSLSLSRVESVVSFYSLYKVHPSRQHHIEICQSLSCSLRGCEELLSCLDNERTGGDEESGKKDLIEYSTVECLAACGDSPVVRVNGAYCEKMTEKKLSEVVKTLQEMHGKESQ